MTKDSDEQLVRCLFNLNILHAPKSKLTIDRYI
jgi:hypothetical protein